MKKALLVLFLVGLVGFAFACATPTATRYKEESKEELRAARIKWWSDVLGKEVLNVEEDYSGGDVPRTRVQTDSGIELIFY